MAVFFVKEETMTDIANAIRRKSGKTEKMLPAEMVSEIRNLEAGNGVSLPELDNPAVASNILANKEAIDEDGEIIVGTMADNGATNLTINALANESVSVPAGYTSGGNVSLTADLKNSLNSINGGTAATNVAGAVDNIENSAETEANLISQIQTALEGKAIGGGGNVETCTVQLSYDQTTAGASYKLSYLGVNGFTELSSAPADTYICVKGSFIAIQPNSNYLLQHLRMRDVTGDITMYYSDESHTGKTWVQLILINSDGALTLHLSGTGGSG